MTARYHRGRRTHQRRPYLPLPPDLRLDEQISRCLYPRVAVTISRLLGRQRPVRHQVEE